MAKRSSPVGDQKKRSSVSWSRKPDLLVPPQTMLIKAGNPRQGIVASVLVKAGQRGGKARRYSDTTEAGRCALNARRKEPAGLGRAEPIFLYTRYTALCQTALYLIFPSPP